jgi:hypothetical protein
MEVRMTRASIAALAVTLLLTTSAGARLSERGKEVAVRLHVVLHLSLGLEDRALASETARAVLDDAGVIVEWHECSALTTACPEPSGPNVVTVRLLETTAGRHQASGHLVRNFRHGSTALVYVPRHRELTRAVRHSPSGRVHPALSTLRTGHLLGLTIAHEVGHALGLHHGPTGVMKAHIGMEDILALRSSRLTFLPDESRRMRQAVSGGATLLVDSEPPSQ